MIKLGTPAIVAVAVGVAYSIALAAPHGDGDWETGEPNDVRAAMRTFVTAVGTALRAQDNPYSVWTGSFGP